MHLIKLSIFWCVGLCALASSVSASSFSFTGTFTTDDQQEIFSFVAGPGGAIMQTWGYAGGVNAAGNTIGAGGFDPILSLFGPDLLLQSSTNLLRTVNDGVGVPADPGSGEHFDSLIDTSAPLLALIPGSTYFLVLSVSDNAPLSNLYGGGFSEQGNGNFTGPLYGCGSGPFCDIDVDSRDGHWAVDITGVSSALNLSRPTTSPVPEPGSFGLLVSGAALCFCLRRKVSVQ